MSELLTIEDLPAGFEYPTDFIRVVELGLVNLEPWWILQGDLLRTRHEGLRRRYPDRDLVVFARRVDRDDVACWDLQSGGISIIHDFASAGYEQVRSRQNFAAFLRLAIEDLIEFDQ